MTKKQQAQFVRKLCNAVRDRVLREDAIPAHWDGYEIRALLAREFAWEAELSLGVHPQMNRLVRAQQRRINKELAAFWRRP